MTRDELISILDEWKSGVKPIGAVLDAVDEYSSVGNNVKPTVICSVCPDCAAYNKKEDNEFTICWNCGNTYRVN